MIAKFFISQLCLLLTLTSGAQLSKTKPVQVLNGTNMLNLYDDNIAKLMQYLEENKLVQSQDTAILTVLLKQQHQPAAVRNIEKMLASKHIMSQYKAYQLLTWQRKMGISGKVVDYEMIWIPRDENMAMPADFIPAGDNGFAMVFESKYQSIKAITEEEAAKLGYAVEEPVPASGRLIHKQAVRAYLLSSARIYPDYDLASDATQKEFLEMAGYSGKDIRLLKKLSNRNNWPVGFNTEPLINAHHPYLLNFTLYKVANASIASRNYVLLWAPQTQNRSVPDNLKPATEEGFFILTDARNIEFGKSYYHVTSQTLSANRDWDGKVYPRAGIEGELLVSSADMSQFHRETAAPSTTTYVPKKCSECSGKGWVMHTSVFGGNYEEVIDDGKGNLKKYTIVRPGREYKGKIACPVCKGAGTF